MFALIKTIGMIIGEAAAAELLKFTTSTQPKGEQDETLTEFNLYDSICDAGQKALWSSVPVKL